MRQQFKIFFHNLRLKRKLIMIILFCILSQNFILLISSNKLLQQQEIKMAKQHIENECFLLQNQFETQYQNTILCSNELIKSINQLLGNNQAKVNTRNLLESSFRYNLHLFPFLDAIIFYGEKGELVYTGTEYSLDPESIETGILSDFHKTGSVQNIFKEIAYRPETGISSEPVLTFCKRVIHIDSGENLGYLIFNIRESKISDLFTNTNQHYYLVNTDGRIVSSTRKKELLTFADKKLEKVIGERIKGNDVLNLDHAESLFTWVNLEDFGYTLVNQIPLAELTDNIRHNTLLILIVCLLTIINIIFLISVINRTVTGPLEYLTGKIRKVEYGDLTTRSHLSRGDELGDISDNFNQMVEEIVKLTEGIKTELEQKRKYELSLVQSQINPHFFYNVLDLIYVMCFQKDAKGAAIVTKYLADYYRGSLSNGKELISLKEEFEIVKSYLSIQKYRYDDILNFELNVESAVENIQIPKLTLQPLVENALYHGIKEWGHGGKIIVSAYRKGNYIFLRVSDNGVGMDEKKIITLLQSEEHPNHFGLKSVILRLNLYYNEKFRFRIFSKVNAGTTILLRIKETVPYQEEF